MVTDLDITDMGSGDLKELCKLCLKGKSTHNIIPKKLDVENPRRLHRVFSDICRPFDIEGHNRCQYFVTLIDGFSHYMWVKPIRSKDEAPKTLIDWLTRAEVETEERPNILRTDSSSEYMGSAFQEWLKTKGMHHEVINVDIPQENGVAERLNRIILEMMRTMLLESELPKSLWTFAVSYTQYILNRLPTRALDIDKTPYEVYHQRKPSVAYLRVFRCNTYVQVPDEKRGKLDAKIVEGFFIGLPENKKGYTVLEHGNLQRVMMSHDVTFFKVLGKSERVRVQVEERPEDLEEGLSKVERVKAMSPDSKHQMESESEGSEAHRKVKSVDTQKKAVNEPTGELRKSKRTKWTPTRDDDPRFSVVTPDTKIPLKSNIGRLITTS